MGFRIFTALYLVCLVSLGWAQDTLRAFEFDGHRRSREVYLRNFVRVEVGQPLDTASINQDVKNLLNTNLFAYAGYELRDTVDGIKVVYVLKEKWTSYPAGNGGIIDENFWIELGWRDNHFIGRGIRWSVLVRYYDRFSVNGFYQAPYWFGNDWGMEANWDIGRTLEPITFSPDSAVRYNQDKIMANALLSFAIKPSNFIYAGYEFEMSEYNNRDGNEESPAAELNEVQRMHRVVLRHHNRYNLNIWEQYVSGWSNELIVKMGIVPDGNRWYPFFQNDLKLFWRPWKSGNLGNRFRVGIAENASSVFAQFIQDSFLNARGLGNKPFRGTAELTNNLELRQTIYNHPFVALQAVAFCDYSIVRPPGGKFEDMFAQDTTRLYAGLGGRIFFKHFFDFILRADYGISLTDRRCGFVLGLGQYF